MMPEQLAEYGHTLQHLLLEMSPFLLLGLTLAGLMKAFMPHSLYHKHLGTNNTDSVLKAIGIGVVLPLCSCGVIPTAVSLRREGASRGACTAFTIATPQTGADCLMATYSLLGLPFTLLRLAASLVTAFFGGWLSLKFDNSDTVKNFCTEGRANRTKRKLFLSRLHEAFVYSFHDMLGDIGQWLVAGLLVAALITTVVPADFLTDISDKPWIAMPLVLLLALPMYLCATGSIPVALSLMLKGMSPGTALVMLMAGPAINVASMIVMGKVFGRRTLLIYIVAIICGAVTFGLATDYLLPREIFLSRLAQTSLGGHETAAWWEYLSAALLTALVFYHAAVSFYSCVRQKNIQNRDSDILRDNCTHYELAVSGMTCDHCRLHVEKAIKTLDGVRYVCVTLDPPQAIADCAPTVKMQDIVRVIETAGYRATKKMSGLSC